MGQRMIFLIKVSWIYYSKVWSVSNRAWQANFLQLLQHLHWHSAGAVEAMSTRTIYLWLSCASYHLVSVILRNALALSFANNFQMPKTHSLTKYIARYQSTATLPWSRINLWIIRMFLDVSAYRPLWASKTSSRHAVLRLLFRGPPCIFAMRQCCLRISSNTTRALKQSHMTQVGLQLLCDCSCMLIECRCTTDGPGEY